jgi:hypothetical protein
MKKSMKKIFSIWLMMIVLCYSTFAQISPDRPGFSNPPSTLQKSKFQLESSIDYTFYQNIDNNELNILNSLFRYGISDYSEIRFTFGYTKISQDDKSNMSGISNIGIGTKNKIYESDNALLPNISVIIGLSLPLGDKNFKTEQIEPSLVLAMSNDLNDKFSVGYNAVAYWSGSDLSYLYSLSLGYSVTEKIGATVGLYSEIYEKESPKQYLEVAFTYLLLDNLQIDIWAANTPFYTIKENFASMGFTWLLN